MGLEKTCTKGHKATFDSVDEILSSLRVTDVTSAVRRAIQGDSHLDILNTYADLDPSGYSDAMVFRDDWLAVNILRKAPFLNLKGVDRRGKALTAFCEGERRCAATNKKLSTAPDSGLMHCLGGTSPFAVISTARHLILNAIGEFSWERASRYMGFSGGATATTPRTKGDPWYKFQNLEVTRDALPVARYMLAEYFPDWARYIVDRQIPFTLVKGNVIDTVEKNAVTDRTIAKEPTLNMFLQKGIGGLLRNLLLKVGVDLNDQTLNQELARLGSLYGHLATLDMSMASDTVCLKLCELLLPASWYNAMVAVRSHFGKLPNGMWVDYEKMSSMGNGFTFELESLIFWALTKAATVATENPINQIGIYGDDIICPVGAVPLLKRTLSDVGFTLNSEKSFWTGEFRESCGKHYLRNVDVTPYTITKPLHGHFNIVLAANQLRRWALRPTDGWSLDNRVSSAWRSIADQLSGRYKTPSIPDGVGDGALFGSLAECLPQRAKKVGGYVAHQKLERVKTCEIDGWAAMMRSLSSMSRIPDDCLGVDPQWIAETAGCTDETNGYLRRASSYAHRRRYYAHLRALASRKHLVGQWGDTLVQALPMPDARGKHVREVVSQDFVVPQWFDTPMWGHSG